MIIAIKTLILSQFSQLIILPIPAVLYTVTLTLDWIHYTYAAIYVYTLYILLYVATLH